ncbi:hypothetical protein THRCLA_21978 [Thraustotheca clavata]|uniref:Transmembrane protein n=1 Tax=Thraustotheca clavata TaxID=74557 RepID=A0A1V9ZFP2_9STRA|nr:hypothetical protein THRCLA_21978 [Thraustotheca clavata]
MNNNEMNEAMKQLRERIQAIESEQILNVLQRTTIDAVGGGVLFFTGISITQVILYGLRISVAMPVLPTLLGSIGVASSSVLVGVFCLRQHPMELEPLQLTAAATSGLLLFRLLGGRFRSLAPSDFRHPGAFAYAKRSLPATIEYADVNARAVIQSFGRLYGCHTCGTKTSKYHADHMPPVLVAKAENTRLLAKIFGHLTQNGRLNLQDFFIHVHCRYYPQCEACSNTQGALVKKNAKQLKLHVTQIRSYHFTGFWMVLFGASGLGSVFSSNNEAPPTVVQQVVLQATEVVQKPHLQLLREREELLKQELRSNTLSKESIQYIKDELSQIQRRKAEIKRLGAYK